MTMNAPLVSTILSCYNSSRFLQQTLDSVRAQTHPNWELIAVDDCSTDNTVEILQRNAEADPRIRVISHRRNAGRPSITKNTGLTNARGEYIQFIDHDDLYEPRKTERLLSALDRHPTACIAFSNMRYINSYGDLGDDYLSQFIEDASEYLTSAGSNEYLLAREFYLFQSLRYSAVQTNTCLLARNRLIEFNLKFDENLRITDDKDLWVRLGLHGGLVYVDESLARYRLHDSNLTRRRLLVAIDSARFNTLNRRRLEPKTGPVEREALRHHEATVYENLGWAYRVARKPIPALLAYAHAMRLKPRVATALAAAKCWLPARDT